MTTTAGILGQVYEERLAQDVKWGPRSYDYCTWMAVLTEEVGEAAREANELALLPFHWLRREWLRAELVQVAAVAVAIIEDLDNGSAEVQ